MQHPVIASGGPGKPGGKPGGKLEGTLGGTLGGTAHDNVAGTMGIENGLGPSRSAAGRSRDHAVGGRSGATKAGCTDFPGSDGELDRGLAADGAGF
ncbi:MAG: hypothetical protein EA350_11490 [Gemmatimonadales bacterium]|nr:MAG: hypothetical protein EA350_11490 [Gemmatimonadales bacterium]